MNKASVILLPMISRYRYKDLTWVDLESPTHEEVLQIMQEFNLPELVAEEMVANSIRSKVDMYENLIYVILHFPLISHHHGKLPEQEVDFVIGKNFLISVRYEVIDPIHEFAKAFEVDAMLDKSKLPSHGGIVFMQMLKELYHHSVRELEGVSKTLHDIESEIFHGHEALMVKKISYTNKKLLDFKQAVRYHQDVLRSYEISSKQFFGESYSYYATTITAEFNKVNSLLEGHRDMLAELQRTNDSLLTSKSNDIMKTFTIMTFVMMPLTIITGVFGMNTSDNVVFIHDLKDFYFVLFAMLLTGIVMFLFFKIKKWL